MAMAAFIKPMLATELFNGLRPLQLSEIARCADRIVFQRDQILIQDGDDADAAILIISGTCLRLNGPIDDASEKTEIIRPGCLLAELAMLVETKHTSTIAAKTPVRALRFTRTQLDKLMRDDPELAEHFAAKLVTRLQNTVENLRKANQHFAAA